MWGPFQHLKVSKMKLSHLCWSSRSTAVCFLQDVLEELDTVNSPLCSLKEKVIAASEERTDRAATSEIQSPLIFSECMNLSVNMTRRDGCQSEWCDLQRWLLYHVPVSPRCLPKPCLHSKKGQFVHAHVESLNVPEEPHIQASCVSCVDYQVT